MNIIKRFFSAVLSNDSIAVLFIIWYVVEHYTVSNYPSVPVSAGLGFIGIGYFTAKYCAK